MISWLPCLLAVLLADLTCSLADDDDDDDYDDYDDDEDEDDDDDDELWGTSSWARALGHELGGTSSGARALGHELWGTSSGARARGTSSVAPIWDRLVWDTTCRTIIRNPYRQAV